MFKSLNYVPAIKYNIRISKYIARSHEQLKYFKEHCYCIVQNVIINAPVLMVLICSSQHRRKHIVIEMEEIAIQIIYREKSGSLFQKKMAFARILLGRKNLLLQGANWITVSSEGFLE